MVVSRVLMAIFFNMGFKDKKFYGVQKERKIINFLGKKAIWFSISIIMIWT